MPTTTTDWQALLREGEPGNVQICGCCGKPVHAALVYQGYYITTYITAGDDLPVCDDCARDVYTLHIELDSLEEEVAAEWKRWRSLRSRRCNAAFRRIGSELRFGRRRR